MSIGIDFESVVLDLSGPQFDELSDAEQLNVLAALDLLQGGKGAGRLQEIATNDALVPQVRFRAAEILAARGGSAAEAWIDQALDSQDPELRRRGVELARRAPDLAGEWLIERIGTHVGNDQDPKVRRAAQALSAERAGTSPAAAMAFATAVADASDGDRLQALAQVVGRADDGDALPQVAANHLLPRLADPAKTTAQRTQPDRQWILLGRLRRAGAALAFKGLRRLRLRLAWRNPNPLAPADRPGIIRSVQFAALSALIAAVLQFSALSPVMGQATAGSMPFPAALLLITTALAALNVWIFARFAQPASSSPDRWAGMVAELVRLSGVALPLALANTLIVAGVMFVLYDAERPLGNAVASALLVAIVFVVTRLTSLIAYGLVATPQGRRTFSTLAGATVGYSLLAVGVIVLAPPQGEQTPASSGDPLLFFGASAIALSMLFGYVDGASEDRRPGDAPLLRWFLLAVLLAPAWLVGLSWMETSGELTDVSDKSLKLGRTKDQAPDPYLLRLGQPVTIKSESHQTLRIEARSSQDIVLHIQVPGKDSTPAIDEDPTSDEIGVHMEFRNLELVPGDYSVMVKPVDESEIGRNRFAAASDRLSRRVFAGVLRWVDGFPHGGLLDGLQSHLKEAHSESRPAPAGYAVISLSGGVDKDASLALERLYNEIKNLRAASQGAGQSDQTGYAIVAPSALRGRDADAQRNAPQSAKAGVGVGTVLFRAAPGRPLRVVQGRAAAVEVAASEVDNSQLVWISRMAAAKRIRDAGMVSAVWGDTSLGPHRETLWAQTLEAMAKVGEPDRLAPFEADKHREPPTRFVVSDDQNLVKYGAGGVFELIGDRLGDPLEARLAYGSYPGVYKGECISLGRANLVSLGDAFDQDWKTWVSELGARAPAQLLGLEKVDRIGDGKSQSQSDAEPSDSCREWSLASTADVKGLAANVGRYVEHFGIDLGASEEPPVFEHFYVVTKEMGVHDEYLPPGTIVRGLTWENDGSPKYDVILGWSNCGETCFIDAHALTYLGPTYEPGFALIPQAFREHWSEEQHRRYDAMALFDRIAEFTRTAVPPDVASEIPAQGDGPTLPSPGVPTDVSHSTTDAPPPWPELASLQGAWIERFGAEVTSDREAPGFRGYFVVTADGAQGAEVAKGTIVRGTLWRRGGESDFEAVYGWAQGSGVLKLDARTLTYLGPEFAAAWLRLPTLGRPLDEAFDFAAPGARFVDRICAQSPGNVCAISLSGGD